MKVLMLNGSCKKEGNTYNALLEIGKQLEKEGIDYEIFQTGSEAVADVQVVSVYIRMML